MADRHISFEVGEKDIVAALDTVLRMAVVEDTALEVASLLPASTPDYSGNLDHIEAPVDSLIKLYLNKRIRNSKLVFVEMHVVKPHAVQNRHYRN